MGRSIPAEGVRRSLYTDLLGVEDLPVQVASREQAGVNSGRP
jgi:hypothetical protein